MHTANGEGSAEASKFEKELHNALEHLHCKHDTRRLTAIMASNQVHIVVSFSNESNLAWQDAEFPLEEISGTFSWKGDNTAQVLRSAFLMLEQF